LLRTHNHFVSLKGEQIMKKTSSKLLVLSLTGLIAASCGDSVVKDLSKNEVVGTNITLGAVATREEVKVGEIYFVATNGLRVRSGDTGSSAVLGLLAQNDEVRIINKSGLNDKFVQIEVVKTSSELRTAEKLFVSFEFLTALRDRDFKYMMVQNIATEKVRVYEKICDDLSCAHKMILETSMVAGEPGDPSEETWLGSYRITGWRKFHQDGKANYPSWYDPSYPAVPPAGRGFTSWMMKKYMPEIDGKKGEMRGAFGWYTAMVGPNHNAQWTHGTVGWGADKDRFIQKTKRLLPNLVTSPRSHGCSRVDNETIAYLRQILPVGTPHIKIYAKEALLDRSRTGYTKEKKPWRYIMTKNGVRTDGQKADREEVLASNISRSEILEEGTYMINQFPEVVPFTPGEEMRRLGSKIGDKGNVYKVDSSNMFGVFYVDAGVVSGYNHPQGLQVGGYEDEIVPDFINLDRMNIRKSVEQ
jgi:hypothetical protein